MPPLWSFRQSGFGTRRTLHRALRFSKDWGVESSEDANATASPRSQHSGSSLADLYDQISMSPDLVKAYQKLDRAVNAPYPRMKFTGASDRVVFLFERYQALTSVS
jgi:hypothetical protein